MGKVKYLTETDLQTALDTWAAAGENEVQAADRIGVARSTLQHRLRMARIKGLKPSSRSPSHELEVEPAPPDEPIEALLQRKKERMARAQAHEEWAKLIPVHVKESGPIALAVIGDPHVDDDYCDIDQLEKDLTTVGRTKGFFAGHVGDFTNNWVGRLAALYASQSTRFDEGLRLTEWMLGLCPNLFVVGGNHDCWNKGMDLLRFIVRQTNAGVVQAHGARMELCWPTRSSLRLHVRHDFPGDSQFNPTHGHRKETLWGHRDHILVAGHKHVDAASVIPSVDGECHWMFRVSGYKKIDDFAKEHGFRPQRMAPSVFLVLNPDEHIPAERVKPFWDVERAAEYLTWLRKRK